MFKKKYIGAALACALAMGAWSGAALAAPINVNGVHWDSSSEFDLTIQSLNLRESSVSKAGDTLTGYGEIGSINGIKDFCSGCDLTFTFSYNVKSITGNQVVFDNGMFQFYTAAGGSFSFADPGSASSGTPWASLAGHEFENVNTGAFGDLFATINGTTSNPTVGSGGFGLLDVTSGPAFSVLNSNSVSDGAGGFADFNLASSFLTKPATGCTSVSPSVADLCHYPIEGNGSLTGMTAATNVPEPGPAGMLGVGLAVIGLLLGRRRKEAAGRA